MRINFHLFVLLSALCFMTSCILNEPNKPSSITGKITNSAGVGIANVTVQVDSTSNNTSVTTAEDGTYQIDFPAGGVCKLSFEKMGYTTQSQIVAIRGGEIQTINTVLKTLSEDAFFVVKLPEPNISFTNNNGVFSFSISTNCKYDFQCSAEWISCTKTSNSFTITVTGNDTFAERNATLLLTSEFGLTCPLYVKQQAGPFLALLDYIGKDGATNFTTSEPFITFNRPVTLKSSSCSEEQLDLSVRYSTDRKTIYFPNLKITPFSAVTVNYSVQSDQNFTVNSKFDLKLYVYSQYVTGLRNMLFTKDNQHLWVVTDTELLQYNASTLLLLKRVLLPANFVPKAQMYYNPFNNSLYLIQHLYANGKNYDEVRIYNASTGNFTSELKLDDGNKLLTSLAFNSKGLGIMVFGGKLYYLDSANNHAFGIFSEQSLLYESTKMLVSNVNTCDDFKTFVLDGASANGTKHVFTLDTDTKAITKVYTGVHTNLVTSFSSAGFFLFGANESKLNYFDLNTSKSTSITTLQPIKNLCPLVLDNEIPNALTSDLSFISLKNTSVNNYSLIAANGIGAIKSRYDSKFIAMLYGSSVYLVSSDLFGVYSSKLK